MIVNRQSACIAGAAPSPALNHVNNAGGGFSRKSSVGGCDPLAPLDIEHLLPQPNHSFGSLGADAVRDALMALRTVSASAVCARRSPV